jgi:hypothetical protein
MENPDNYINIDETINNIDNLKNDINSIANGEFVLSLLGKCFEKKGTQMYISKISNEKFKNMGIASLQSLISLGNHKKFELHFNFGEKMNEEILNDPVKQQNFIDQYKQLLSKELSIDVNNFIFTDIHRGTVGVHVTTLNQNQIDEKAILSLKGKHNIEQVDEKPLLEVLILNKEILDPFGDRSEGWGQNETRGGEDYLPPTNGWIGIGLKVSGKYDKGKDDWLDYRNKNGEFAIAYLGIDNNFENSEKMVIDMNYFSTNIKTVIKEKLYSGEENLRKSTGFFSKIFGGDQKCGHGVCLFQNPLFAENNSGVVKVRGYKLKVILMCRVNPKKIRQPKSFPECWILNPTPDEIRPYRILIKRICNTSLTEGANNNIILTKSPMDYITSILKSNDFSFLEHKNKYTQCLNKNGTKLNDEQFLFNFYSSEYYREINNFLRNEKASLCFLRKEEIISVVCCLHKALQKKRRNKVKKNTIVYRGINKFKFSEDIGIGSKFYFREFYSTSLSKEKAESFIGKNGTLMIIRIENNGLNNLPCYCYNITNFSNCPDEKEVLLTTHCHFIVEKIVRGDIDIVNLTCEGYLLNFD